MQTHGPTYFSIGRRGERERSECESQEKCQYQASLDLDSIRSESDKTRTSDQGRRESRQKYWNEICDTDSVWVPVLPQRIRIKEDQIPTWHYYFRTYLQRYSSQKITHYVWFLHRSWSLEKEKYRKRTEIIRLWSRRRWWARSVDHGD